MSSVSGKMSNRCPSVVVRSKERYLLLFFEENFYLVNALESTAWIVVPAKLLIEQLNLRSPLDLSLPASFPVFVKSPSSWLYRHPCLSLLTDAQCSFE